MTTKNIDEHISEIMEKMKGLSAKKPKYSCGAFPPKWEAPLIEEKVAEFEAQNGIRLPEDYRRFITVIAAGGTQPFYGLRSIFSESGKKRELEPNLKTKFPFSPKNYLNISKLSEEEYNGIFEKDNLDNIQSGFIELCHEGCGMYSILIVNSDNEETYGTVWYYDLANDAGIFPLTNLKDGKPLSFLDWLEYYVDRTLELGDNEFFGYAALICCEE